MSEITAYLVFKPNNMGTFENHFHTDGAEPKDGHVMGFAKIRAKIPGWKLRDHGGQSVIAKGFGVGTFSQYYISISFPLHAVAAQIRKNTFTRCVCGSR